MSQTGCDENDKGNVWTVLLVIGCSTNEQGNTWDDEPEDTEVVGDFVEGDLIAV